MKTFDSFFDSLNDIMSSFGKETPKKKRKYTKRTIKVDDKDIVTEFHPEILFNINRK